MRIPMFENIKEDLDRYCQKEHAKTLLQKINIVLNRYGLQATLIYRFGKWAENQPLFLKCLLFPIYCTMEFIIRNLYGIHIQRKALIGKGLYIGHCGGIVIGRSKIGAFCSIHQHVKIKPDFRGNPKVGDRVWIGAHTQIIGPLAIAQNAALGAGTVVQSDVGERCLALGSPARVINKDFDNREILFGKGWKEHVKNKNAFGTKNKPVYSQKPAYAYNAVLRLLVGFLSWETIQAIILRLEL